MTNNYFADDAIIARFNRPDPSPAAKVDHELLLPLPLEMRHALDAEAHTMQNYIGGRRSDCLRRAISTWEAGGGFPYRDRAHRHIAAENAANINNTGPRIILPMN
jgi:hypothetical protein